MKRRLILLVVVIALIAGFGALLHSPPSIIDAVTGATPKAKKAAQSSAQLEGSYIFCMNPLLDKLSDEDIQELGELLPDSSRLFKETSDYRSLGVFSNFDYSVIIGSDVQDWNKYETSKFADIRLPVQTFEQFCLLAKKMYKS